MGKKWDFMTANFSQAFMWLFILIVIYVLFMAAGVCQREVKDEVRYGEISHGSERGIGKQD